MQQSLLFQNIYNFLKKDQILADFWSQHWAYPSFFRTKVRCSVASFSYQGNSTSFYYTDNYHSSFITFYWFFRTFLTVTYLTRRVPLGSEKIFCHRFLKNCDSSIELSVLITNIIFFLKINWTIANIWSTFWKA